jgi:YggT family protein
MSAAYFTGPAVFLADTLFSLYTFAVLLRFLLQWVGADYYNPVCQFLVKVTHPPLRLLRRVIPPIGRIDTASLVLLTGLEMANGYLRFLLQGASITLASLAVWAVMQLIELVLNVFFFAIMAHVVLGWLGTRPRHPGISLINSLAEPLLAPARRWLPAVGGFDFSPMVPLILIELAKMMILPPLHQWINWLNL